MALTPEELAELHIYHGRITALQTFCFALARSLPADIATSVAPILRNAAARVEADVLALPVADGFHAEVASVLRQLERLVESERPSQ